MSTTKSLERIRIFVAGPSDVETEKQSLTKVILRLNETLGIRLGTHMDIADWSSHVRPALAARPEDAVLGQIPVNAWDIFIGLLWLRFGNLPGGTDPHATKPFESGTEEEFTLAYRCWKHARKPTIMFYQCARVPSDLAEIDAPQLQKVNNFFEGLGPDKTHPGLYTRFRETKDFEEQVNKHLTDLLSELHKRQEAQEETATADRTGEFLSALESGQAYEMVVVSVDIAGHSQIVRRNPGEAKRVLDWFEKFVFRNMQEYNGTSIAWTPDGGLFALCGEKSCDQAALVGIQLLTQLEIFNLNPDNQIKLGIRIGAQVGTVEWVVPTNRISSDVLNFAKHLESEGTHTGEFRITEAVRRRLNDPVKSAFVPSGRFQGTQTSCYQAQHQDGPTDEVVTSLVAKVDELLEQFPQLSAGTWDERAYEQASASVDGLYTALDQFIGFYPRIDDRWSSEYVNRLDGWATRLLDAEKHFWETLQASYAQSAKDSSEAEQWRSIAEIVGSRRTGTLFPLIRLKAQAELRISGLAGCGPATLPTLIERGGLEAVGSPPTSPELARKIQSLVLADELQEEELFADLMANDHDALISAIATQSIGQQQQALLDRLWTLTDLIMIEEQQQRRKGSKRLIACLLKQTAVADRYRVLVDLLRSPAPPTREAVQARFRELGMELREKDLHVVWRTVLVGAVRSESRDRVVSIMPIELTWRIVAYPRVPVYVLWSVAQQIKEEDLNKVFFDCTRARLKKEIQASGPELNAVSKLISLFFTMKFFVQSPYFERLEDLLLDLRRIARTMGSEFEPFDKIMKRLKEIREDLGNPQAKIPRGIESLPLPVQRHLAADGSYLDSFVLHPDFRIAGETLAYIDLGNIDRIINYRQINDLLFSRLLRRREFFTRLSTIVGAISHPKCPTDFARANIQKVRKEDLRRIAANVNANSAVRTIAKELLGSRTKS